MPDGPAGLGDTMALLKLGGAGVAAQRSMPRLLLSSATALLLLTALMPCSARAQEAMAEPVLMESKPARISTGLVTIESDQQRADQLTGVITATGNVRIVYPDERVVATARQAQYFSKENRVVLSGDVDIVQEGGNLIRAERVVYLVDGERLIAIPPAGRQVFSRVRMPQSSTSPGSSANP